MDHHEEVRVFLGCIDEGLKLVLGVEVVEIMLEPVLPVEILHLHDLVLVVGVDSPKAREVLVHGVSEVIHFVLFGLLEDLVEEVFPLLPCKKLFFSDGNFLELSFGLQILVEAFLFMVVAVVEISEFELIISSASPAVLHDHLRATLSAEHLDAFYCVIWPSLLSAEDFNIDFNI